MILKTNSVSTFVNGVKSDSSKVTFIASKTSENAVVNLYSYLMTILSNCVLWNLKMFFFLLK